MNKKIKTKNLQITYDEGKWKALKIYMESENISFDEKITELIDNLYAKYVPDKVRAYFKLSEDFEKNKATSKEKNEAISSECHSENNATN